MLRVTHILTGFAAAVAITGPAACGSGSASNSDVVATVAHTPISRSSLEHWTAALGASDFYEHIGKRAPAGLVPGAPSESSCVKVAAGLIPPPSQPKPTRAVNTARCRELYSEVREQALSYLIAAQWRSAEGAAHGVVVSDAEIAKLLQQQESEHAAKPAQFAAYLADRGRTLADERFELREDLITKKLIAKLEHDHPGGGLRHAIGQLAASAAGQRATTDCRPGYIVPECKQYRAAAPVQPQRTPALIVEEMSKTY